MVSALTVESVSGFHDKESVTSVGLYYNPVRSLSIYGHLKRCFIKGARGSVLVLLLHMIVSMRPSPRPNEATRRRQGRQQPSDGRTPPPPQRARRSCRQSAARARESNPASPPVTRPTTKNRACSTDGAHSNAGWLTRH